MSLSCRTGDGSEFLLQAKDEVQLWGVFVGFGVSHGAFGLVIWGLGRVVILGGLMVIWGCLMVILGVSWWFCGGLMLILMGPSPHFRCP